MNPKAPSRLLRTRLNERLTRATRFPVALIAAPAGFGKSVALGDFIATSRLDAIRYDVRREDRTLAAFLRGLAEALAPYAPAAAAAFPDIQTRLLTSTDPVRDAADWLGEHLRRTVCTVVIDDLHYAATDPHTNVFLAEMVERTATRINWIVATRSDVGLPIASWIAYGRMDMPVTEDDLRFTLDEALAVADDEVQTAASDIETMLEHTGGWPVALTFALRTRTNANDLRSAATGTRDMVYRYLAEQVFARLEREQQEFLLRSSVFPWIDADIATQLGAGESLLDTLRRNATFLTEISVGRYRYHDLFRDFLESQLQRRGSRALEEALVAAAAILRSRGETTAALQTLVRAKDEAGIVDVLHEAGFSLLERGEAELLATAFGLVREPSFTQLADVLGLRAVLDANTGNFERAQRRFSSAIAIASAPDERARLVHRYAIELIRRNLDAVPLLEEHSVAGAHPEMAAALKSTLATAYARIQDNARASETSREALHLIPEGLSEEAQARIYQQAAYVAHQSSHDLQTARRYATQAAALAIKHQLYDIGARAYSVLYNIAYDEDDVIDALAMLDKLDDCARKCGNLTVRSYALIAAYELEVERANDPVIERLDEQLRAFDKIADTDAGISREQREEALVAAFALRATWTGDFSIALSLLRSSSDPSEPDRLALRLAETAGYAAAAGDPEAADAVLDEAIAKAAHVDIHSRRVARARILIALTLILLGRLTAAHRALTELENARIRFPRIVAFMQSVRALYRQRLEQGDAASYASSLERLRSLHAGGLARMLERVPYALAEGSGFAALTPAEREILQALAHGASTKDVANTTGRSPHTVDTHIRAICRKLGCSGRREAVALAITHGWVSS